MANELVKTKYVLQMKDAGVEFRTLENRRQAS